MRFPPLLSLIPKQPQLILDESPHRALPHKRSSCRFSSGFLGALFQMSQESCSHHCWALLKAAVAKWPWWHCPHPFPHPPPHPFCSRFIKGSGTSTPSNSKSTPGAASQSMGDIPQPSSPAQHLLLQQQSLPAPSQLLSPAEFIPRQIPSIPNAPKPRNPVLGSPRQHQPSKHNSQGSKYSQIPRRRKTQRAAGVHLEHSLPKMPFQGRGMCWSL